MQVNIFIFSVFLISFGRTVHSGTLFLRGVVHYSIDKRDYDPSSEEVIGTTLQKLENEICVKFFKILPSDFIPTLENRLLFISNPKKIKYCNPVSIDFNNSTIYYPIGYKCLTTNGIVQKMVELLKSSIDNSPSLISSYDLMKTYKALEAESEHDLLSLSDRNYINAYYAKECKLLTEPLPINHTYSRRSGSDDKDIYDVRVELNAANLAYYEPKLWPLGIVMYGIDSEVKDTAQHEILKEAIKEMEASTCLVFVDVSDQDPEDLTARNIIWFNKDGADSPALGLRTGNQTVSLTAITTGTLAHSAHTLNNLMRIIGVPMMSNRDDRDHFLKINFQHVIPDKKHLLERVSKNARLLSMPYDFNSVTHAPSNYYCHEICYTGALTVEPRNDQLWVKTRSMGHTKQLSMYDKLLVKALYQQHCHQRNGDI